MALGRSIADGVFGVGVWAAFGGLYSGEQTDFVFTTRPYLFRIFTPFAFDRPFDDITQNKCSFTSGCLKFIPTFNGIRGYSVI